MGTSFRSAVVLFVLPLGLSLTAQTLDLATSVPTAGMVINFNDHFDPNPTALATTGAGNVWDATGVTPSGTYNFFVFYPPISSPFAATYPTTTICADVQSNSAPIEWRHWNASATSVELLGVNTDAYVGGRTLCEFPFTLGSSFTDSYTIGGNTTTDQITYVASGQVQAPWATIPNVVMFSVNNAVYVLYTTDNVLEPLGTWVPGFGLQLEEVTVMNGIAEQRSATLGIWPSPTSDVAHVALPFSGTNMVTISDAAGRTVQVFNALASPAEIDARELMPGLYTVCSVSAQGQRATGRLVVQ